MRSTEQRSTDQHSTEQTSTPANRPRGNGVADLVRWGPVLSGVVVGLGAFALFDILWFAIAAGNGNGAVDGNLQWFVGGTAIGAMLVAGLIAGLLAGVRGIGAGLANGVTTWGFLVLLAVVGGVPGTLGLNGTFDLGMTVDQVLWTVFWSLLIGLGCAALGGVLGGLVHRPVVTATRRTAGQDTSAREPAPRESLPRESLPRETLPRETVTREVVAPDLPNDRMSNDRRTAVLTDNHVVEEPRSGATAREVSTRTVGSSRR